MPESQKRTCSLTLEEMDLLRRLVRQEMETSEIQRNLALRAVDLRRTRALQDLFQILDRIYWEFLGSTPTETPSPEVGQS